MLAIEASNERQIEYDTVHGWRILSCDRPELNQFFVCKEGVGFAKALAMPYIRSISSASQIPQLLVEYIVSDAAIVGYAKSIELPYYVAGSNDDYPVGTLVICINAGNTEAISAGYANALIASCDCVSCSSSRASVQIENMQMLDTDCDLSLVDFPRFG